MITPLRHTPLLPGTLYNLFYPPEKYGYFARAKEIEFPAAGWITKAAWAADAAMLAYGRYGEVPMKDAELAKNFRQAGLDYDYQLIYEKGGQKIGEKNGGTVDDWNAPGTQGYFASCEDYAICAFRGTERDDPEDLRSDFDLFLTQEPDYRPVAKDPEVALGFLNIVSHLFTETCLVHRGFQGALATVWARVHELVTGYRATHPGKEICFTGHSLGAALAVLAFSRFGDPDVSLFTFGCPRVGNGAFRDRVLASPGRGISRFVNYNDAVTHVPTESLLYRQTPESCYRFSEEGNLDTDDGSFKGDVESLGAAIAGLPASLKLTDLNNVRAPPSLVDHSPARYCFRLWDCVDFGVETGSSLTS